VNFGVLSIYQPGKCQGQGVFPRFTWFCAGFLENSLAAVALWRYIWWIKKHHVQQDAVFIQSVQTLPQLRN
jgi:hypothetical protein